MQLAQKTAIITGGASGFGEGIVRRFANEGANIVIADINDQQAENLCTQITQAGGKAIYHHCDVTSKADWGSLRQTALEKFSHIDIVVNNAGMPQINQPMLDVDEETFSKIFDVNVKSIYLSAQAILPLMQAQKSGVIINTASTAALRPRPGLTWYNASKGAVVTLTKSMAVELAPDNIRVNALCPVAGDTPMLAAFMGGEVTDDMRDKFRATVPLGRFSTPQDLANAALFLASAESDFLTGVCLEVDGGRCI